MSPAPKALEVFGAGHLRPGDSMQRRTMQLLGLLALLQVFDLATTSYGIHALGKHEANGIMAPLLEAAWLPWVAKGLALALALAGTFILARNGAVWEERAQKLLVGFCWLFAAVGVSNLAPTMAHLAGGTLAVLLAAALYHAPKRFKLPIATAMVALAFLAILPGASAQLEVETFGDDTVGQNPSASWYSYTEPSEPGASGVVNADLGNGTSQAWAIDPGTTTPAEAIFTLDNPRQLESIEMDMDCSSGHATAPGISMFARDSGGTSLFRIKCLGNDALGQSSDAYPGFYSGGFPVNLRVEIDWDLEEITVLVDDNSEGTWSFDNSGTEIEDLRFNKAGTNSMDWFMDNLLLDGDELPAAPEEITGLAGTVTDGGGSQRTATLAFPVAPNDPDQNNGELDYQILLQGVVISNGDGITISEGIVTMDEDLVGGSSFGLHAFQVRALNQTIPGPWSCQIDLDMDEEGDTDSCGTDPPPAPPGGGVGNGGVIGDGTFPGIDIGQTATDLGMTTEALGWFLGILLVTVMAGVFAFVGKTPSPGMGILGGLLGTGMSVAFSLIPVWFVVLLIFAFGAVVFFVRR